jgi:hypothetical protein
MGTVDEAGEALDVSPGVKFSSGETLRIFCGTFNVADKGPPPVGKHLV